MTQRRGPTEAAYERALTAARKAGRLNGEDAALIAAGRASARLVDDAATDGTVWMREAAIRRHVETLAALELTPGTRPAGADPIMLALARFTTEDQLHAPAWSDTAEPAPLRPATG